MPAALRASKLSYDPPSNSSADPHGVLAPDVEVDVVGHLERARRPVVVHAGAALVERLEHVDRRPAGHRRRLVGLAVELDADLVQRRLADQALDLEPDLIVAAAALDRALGEREVADALVGRLVLAAPVFQPQRLVVGQRVLDAGRDVGGLARAAHLIAVDAAVFVEREDGGRVVGPVAVERHAQRRLARDQRSAERHVEAAELLGRLESARRRSSR